MFKSGTTQTNWKDLSLLNENWAMALYQLHSRKLLGLSISHQYHIAFDITNM